MRAIRNFFHDINDVLLALIIVVIAAGIIYWRMEIILDYPRQLAAEQASYELEDEEYDPEDIYDTEDEDADDAEEAEASDAEDKADDGEAQPQG